MMDYKKLKGVLEERIMNSDQVFIVPHLGIDFDAIASSIALTLIANKYKKPNYIILDEELIKIEPGVKLIISNYNNKSKFITSNKAMQLKGDNDLLIATDVNKKYLVGIKDHIDEFNDVMIIDHHETDKNTIQTKEDGTFIGLEESSVSEILTELLGMFNIKIEPNIANYLLTGIYLDTDKLRKNLKPTTTRIVTKLLERGANIETVNKYFEEDFNSDRKIQALINKTKFLTYTIAMAIENGEVEYTKEELAKVADYLQRFNVDVSLAAGHINDSVISVSARSNGNFDIGKVMGELGGGGDIYKAATKIENEESEEVERVLVRTLTPKYYIGKC